MQEETKSSFSEKMFVLWRASVDQAVESVFTNLKVESDANGQDEGLHHVRKNFNEWKKADFGENTEIFFTLLAVSNFPCSSDKF
jgi:hypothetical protein